MRSSCSQRGWDSNLGCHGCEPSALPLSYPTIPALGASALPLSYPIIPALGASALPLSYPIIPALGPSALPLSYPAILLSLVEDNDCLIVADEFSDELESAAHEFALLYRENLMVNAKSAPRVESRSELVDDAALNERLRRELAAAPGRLQNFREKLPAYEMRQV